MTLGAIPYTVIALALFGMILMISGFIMDVILQADNELHEDTSLPYSKARGDSMGLLTLFFNAMGFVALITAFIFLIMNANQRSSGEI